jgi:hypothetical protein
MNQTAIFAEIGYGNETFVSFSSPDEKLLLE